jgi:hypothetical protein
MLSFNAFEHVYYMCDATINEALDFLFFTCSQVVKKNFSIGRIATMYTVACQNKCHSSWACCAQLNRQISLTVKTTARGNVLNVRIFASLLKMFQCFNTMDLTGPAHALYSVEKHKREGVLSWFLFVPVSRL